MKLGKVISSCFYLIIISIIVFFIQISILYAKQASIFSNYIIQAYIFNVSISLIALVLIFFLSKKYRDQLGYIFLTISLCKFLFFFLIFKPIYKADGVISTDEFFSFFTPYLTCLISTSYILSRFLNNIK